jgi:probable HAF family extracellular repeat protein
MINLGGLLLGGPSYGVAINNNGQAVGNAAATYTAATGYLNHAFLWSTNTGMMDLGTLGTNGSSSANAINNNGQVVGKSGGHAFLYSGGRMTDLNSFISSYSGWTLQSANGINNSGEIVGQGINPSGLSHAFLLFPNPHRATAIATVLNGSVAGATIMDGGSGYGSPPTVLIQGGGGTGATATAVVSNGFVVSITITDAGTGYTNPPSIYIYSPLGLQIGLIKAVSPTFSDLLIGTNYQLQVSGDLINWTNQGSPFTATNPTSIYPQYWNVDNWSQLFFRLQVSP